MTSLLLHARNLQLNFCVFEELCFALLPDSGFPGFPGVPRVPGSGFRVPGSTFRVAVLTLNCFSFGDNYYKQINGVAMGTQMGPTVATPTSS